MERLRLAQVIQNFPRPRIRDVEAATAAEMRRLSPSVRPGMRVAITAGSRGITGIAVILKTAARVLRDMGAEPFLVSAMGSHGGGTESGQREILKHLGITEESVGAPMRVTAQAVEVGTIGDGRKLHVDAEAARAEGILAVNRLKPHTAFQESLASGLMKMLAVGLGKVPGAAEVHRSGSSGIYKAVLEMGRLALDRLPIIGGLAIVENSYEETARVQMLMPHEIEEGERVLLEYASGLLPRLPLKELDLLIIDEIGKNYSGTGMDTNVVGRWKDMDVKGPVWPRIRRIVALGLSTASEGNANGIGLADFTTRRLVHSIDWRSTLTNVMTTGFWNRAFCPPFPGNDREAIQWALDSLKQPPDAPVCAARIRNTLHLEELWLSPRALERAEGCRQVGAFAALRFNEEGIIVPGG